MTSFLFVTEGPQQLSVGEERVFQINCANVIGEETITEAEVTEVINLATGEDEKEETMPTGSATISGSSIVLPVFHALSGDTTYRIQFSFQAGGNKFLRHINVPVAGL